MKKTLFAIGLLTAVTVLGQNFQSASFLNDNVKPLVNGSVVTYGGITITNAAAAPLGGYTNIASWSYGGIQTTNNIKLTWTNTATGIWVIPTNNTPGSVTGLYFVTNDVTPLTKDVALWVDSQGRTPVTITTNNWAGDATAFALSPVILTARIWGDTSAATKLNLIFVGVPNGVEEPSSTTTTSVPTAFEWGIVPAAGTQVVVTNFPIWKFAGCKAVRLRSATLTTTTAANIGVTLQSLDLSGFRP